MSGEDVSCVCVYIQFSGRIHPAILAMIKERRSNCMIKQEEGDHCTGNISIFEKKKHYW